VVEAAEDAEAATSALALEAASAFAFAAVEEEATADASALAKAAAALSLALVTLATREERNYNRIPLVKLIGVQSEVSRASSPEHGAGRELAGLYKVYMLRLANLF
jgi:hypothetical protein